MDTARKKEVLEKFNPPQQHFSGLESDNLKLQGCSLLVPHDVYYQVGPCTLPPQQKLQIDANKFVDFAGCQTIMIKALSESGSSRILPLHMVIAGKVRFTRSDYNLFRLGMQSKKDARRMGLEPNGVMDWPDVRALCLCPVCGTTQEPENQECWLLLHHLQQVDVKSSVNFATRDLPRLCCISCFDTMWANMKHGGGLRQEIVDRNPAFPVAGYAPLPRQIMTVADNFSLWQTSGAYQALDHKLRQQTFSDANSAIQGPDIFRTFNQFTDKDPRVAEKNDETSCLTCGKIREGGNLLCSRCKVAYYCCRDCQKQDRGRHRFFCRKQG